MKAEILELARQIWDYHLLRHELQESDCILALGSNDTRVAERAAELYLQGLAPLVIFSGGVGNLTRGMFAASEAEAFAEIAIEKGVPDSAILLEKKSTNTGENIQLTQKLLEQQNESPQSFIIVQKPFMERRAFATFKKNWSNKEVLVTSPQIPFEAYPNEVLDLESIIHVMVGDFQRIMEYPAKGFQIEQPVPEEIVMVFNKLIQAGYTDHLITA
jgi:uncharacterized SAM-binding protein YcdF (DUF218 family)